MKTYTESKPVFSEEIPVTEPTDSAHADNINAAPKQLLQNTLHNRNEISELKKGNNKIEFDDQGPGTDIPGGGDDSEKVPDPAEAIEEITSGKSVPTLISLIKTALKGLLSLSESIIGKITGLTGMIAGAYSEDQAYDNGEYCIHEESMYRFTGKKEPGIWDPASVQEVTVAEEIRQLSENISETQTLMKSFKAAKSKIISSALGKALSIAADATIDTVANKIAGVTNRGAVSGSISTSGGTYMIPAGYHNGSGKVTGPALDTLVGSNVNLDSNARLLSGYTAYGMNGAKYTGSIANYSTAKHTATTDATNQAKSCFRISGTSVQVVPAVGYWGAWNWDASHIAIAAASLGVIAGKILNDTTICGVKGTVAMKTSGSTAVTASGKYGYDTTNGFWMYIPANAYYGTGHWLNVPAAQAMAVAIAGMTKIVDGSKVNVYGQTHTVSKSVGAGKFLLIQVGKSDDTTTISTSGGTNVSTITVNGNVTSPPRMRITLVKTTGTTTLTCNYKCTADIYYCYQAIYQFT